MKNCAFEECNGRHYAKGYCKAHYMQHRRGNTLTRLHGGRYNGYKICTGCKQDKPDDAYYKRADGEPRSHCKDCMREATRQRRVRSEQG